MKLIELRPYGSPSFDEAVPQGQPTVETPLQEFAPTHYVITQRYMQRVEAYKKPEENARMPREILPSLGVVAYHCYDGPRTPVNGSQIITFDRVWATVPTGFEDPEQFTVTGKQPSAVKVEWKSTYYASTSVVTTFKNLGVSYNGSDFSMNAKTQRDFFLVGKNSSYPYTGSIPSRNETLKNYYDWSSMYLGVEFVNSYFYNAIGSAPFQSVPISSGYIVFPVLGYAGYAGSSNSQISGELMQTETISGSLIYGNSKLVRYIGNIWERRSVNATII